MSADESRTSQIRRAAVLPAAAGWSLTPCAYEHFALIAAEGEPERFTVLPQAHAPVTAACPRVDPR